MSKNSMKGLDQPAYLQSDHGTLLEAGFEASDIYSSTRNKSCDQTVQMSRLIYAFTVCIFPCQRTQLCIICIVYLHIYVKQSFISLLHRFFFQDMVLVNFGIGFKTALTCVFFLSLLHNRSNYFFCGKKSLLLKFTGRSDYKHTVQRV